MNADTARSFVSPRLDERGRAPLLCVCQPTLQCQRPFGRAWASESRPVAFSGALQGCHDQYLPAFPSEDFCASILPPLRCPRTHGLPRPSLWFVSLMCHSRRLDRAQNPFPYYEVIPVITVLAVRGQPPRASKRRAFWRQRGSGSVLTMHLRPKHLCSSSSLSDGSCLPESGSVRLDGSCSREASARRSLPTVRSVASCHHKGRLCLLEATSPWLMLMLSVRKS